MTASNPRLPASKALRVALWVAQILIALVYIPAGGMKLFSPVAEVAAQIPWAGDVPVAFLRFIGMVDLAAGLGVLLPSITRIAPKLTVWAAVGSVLLQCCALCFHISRGEYVVVPVNLVVMGLSFFVAKGRARRAPIAARGQDELSAA